MSFGLGFWAAAGAGGGAGGGAAYEQIATAFGTGSSGTITFSSIDQSYKHLQIRASFKSTSTNGDILVRFNSDSGANYPLHSLRGNGTTVSSGAQTATTAMYLDNGMSASTTTGAASAVVVDILDYSVTTKNKTIRSLHGKVDTSNWIFLESGMWMNTAAVSTISLIASGNNFSTLTRASLYGIRG